MNKLRILLFSTIIASLLLVSCEKNPAQPNTPASKGFTATTTEYVKGSAKTTLDDFMPLWSAGDRICVWGSDLMPRQCMTTGRDTTVAFFKYDSLPEGIVRGPYTAIYPASLFRSPTRITVPPTQNSLSGTLSGAPAYAHSDTNQLDFYNLCGVVRLKLTGPAAKRITYVILFSDQIINGEYDLVENPDNPLCPQLSYVSGGTSNTILNVAHSSQGDGNYYIAIPAGTYSSLSAFLYTTDQMRASACLGEGEPIVVEQNSITAFTLENLDFSKPTNKIVN